MNACCACESSAVFVGDFFVHLPATNVVKLTIHQTEERGILPSPLFAIGWGLLPEWIENMSRANLRLFVFVFL